MDLGVFLVLVAALEEQHLDLQAVVREVLVVMLVLLGALVVVLEVEHVALYLIRMVGGL